MKVHYPKSQDEIPMPTFFVLGRPATGTAAPNLKKPKQTAVRSPDFPEGEQGPFDPNDVAARIVDWLRTVK